MGTPTDIPPSKERQYNIDAAKKTIELNIPQKNHLLIIAEMARAYNNYKDCDVIEEATQQVEKATSKAEALDAISYLKTAITSTGVEQ